MAFDLKNNRLRLLSALALGSTLLAGMVVHFGLTDVGHAIRNLQPLLFLAYLALASLVVVGWSARSMLIARATTSAEGTPAFSRFLAARLAGDAVGALIPGGRISGDPLRVVLLKGQRGSAVVAGSWILLDRIAETGGNILAGFAYVGIFLWQQLDIAIAPIATVFIAAFIGLLTMVVILAWGGRPFSRILAPAVRRLPRLRAVGESLLALEDELVTFLRWNGYVFLQGLALSVLIELVIVLEYGFLFHAFSIDIDLSTLLLALLATGMARGIPAPGGVGTIEAGQVAALSYGMGRPDLGFVAGIVMRLHETLWTCAGLVVVLRERPLRNWWRSGSTPQDS